MPYGAGVDLHTKSSQPELLACWAKLGYGEESPSYHPLLCHMIDAASVAREMWRSVLSHGQQSELAGDLGFNQNQEAAAVWCAFLAGLHDLGKASPAFQLRVKQASRREEVKQRLRGIGLRVYDLSLNPPPHGTITAATLPGILTAEFDVAGRAAKRIGVVVGGHHGVFPTNTQIHGIKAADKGISGQNGWDNIRRQLTEQLADLLELPRDRRPGEIGNAAAMILSGFVTVADWIGSNTDFFHYAAPSNLAAYARDAETQARKALDQLGWCLQPPRGGIRHFAELFQKIAEPNDLQRAIVSVASEFSEPGLVIIEAPMGEGKTEAAMYLANHWAESAGQRGCYFALPTQATSNQMFGRVRDFLSSRYAGDLVQLQLLHGHASLSSEFELLRRNYRAFTPNSVEQDANHAQDTDHAGVVAAEWFTYRKRGLLAPFGVGTIDQALLAALQTKHVFVRLFGLARKTVVVDEVHAYDVYMSTLLERLLEWLAALGSSVVLLSATLPKARREALLAAYTRGSRKPEGVTLPRTEYPRVSWVSAASGSDSRTVAVSSRGEKDILLEWRDGLVPSQDGERVLLGEILEGALSRGGCAAVICNTVSRAQEVYRALKPYFPGTAGDGGPELDLFHSQYLFEDREKRERRSLSRFGKPGGTVVGEDGYERPVNRPHRAVLVATQVIEQSLDLDFDLMVSDMAPADLLLQRAGRLHRHERPRPSGLDQPGLLVCRPDMDNDVPQFDSGTAAVYHSHVLLRSWLALRDRKAIRVPQDVEDIIESVYDDDCHPDDLPGPLRERWESTWKEFTANTQRERDEALKRWIKPPSYNGELWHITEDTREEDAPEFHREHQALTRLAPPSVPVVFLFGGEDRSWLDSAYSEQVDLSSVPSTDTVKRLLRRTVSISNRRIVFELLKQLPPTSWRRTALLRNHRAVFLNASGVSNVGSFEIALDVEAGVVVSGRE